MPRVAPIPVAWPGQVNTCQSVPTSYKTNMRKCMHNSQGEEGLLTIIYLENGHHSLLVFNTPACSHILRPSRLVLDHGLQLLNQVIWKLNIFIFLALLCQPDSGRPFLPQFLHRESATWSTSVMRESATWSTSITSGDFSLASASSLPLP